MSRVWAAGLIVGAFALYLAVSASWDALTWIQSRRAMRGFDTESRAFDDPRADDGLDGWAT